MYRSESSSGFCLFFSGFLEKKKKSMVSFVFLLSKSSVVDPDSGSSAFLAPGSGMGKKSGSGSGI
jgi:hypothetical protein